MTEPIELYRRYRPKTFKEILGQPEAITTIGTMVKEGKIPHALLLTGPSGCGKTTIARILKDKLDCHDEDFIEVNAAESRGIDTIRTITQQMTLSPWGKCRMWLLDEAQKLSSDGQAALLKPLEDTPSHVYFILCTTDPQKLLPTIKTRCTEVRLNAVDPISLESLIKNILARENVDFLSSETIQLLVEVADGSARKALVLLHQVIGLNDDNKAREAIQKSDVKRQAVEIARALIKPKCKWSDVNKLLKNVIDEDPETIRRIILGYCNKILLSDNRSLWARSYAIINTMEPNLYDSGKAGLTAACFRVCNQS